jgi:hypothetical protein
LKNTVNLHFASTSRGPGKVVENLARGLNKIGWDVTGNSTSFDKEIYQGVLQSVPSLGFVGKDAIAGPNLFVLPTEWGNNCSLFDHYIVPSKWVEDKYREYDCLSHASIDVWPVGIDTDQWVKEKNSRQGRVAIYYKNRPKEDLDNLTSHLRDLNIDFGILEYGRYDEQDLYNVCHLVDAFILLTGTESQGVAYMQILSMGIPCFVLNKSKFDYMDRYVENPIPSTSVPYFNESCGIIVDEFDRHKFQDFMDKIESYDPRSFIMDNHTLEIGAKKYVEILVKYRR